MAYPYEVIKSLEGTFNDTRIDFEKIFRHLNQNGSPYFKIDTLIQQAMTASESETVREKSPFVKGNKVSDGFLMSIGVANAESQEICAEFLLRMPANGLKNCQCFNLIVMTSIFQDWFHESFLTYLPLPRYKTANEPRELFVPPNFPVTQVYPSLPDNLSTWFPEDGNSWKFDDEIDTMIEVITEDETPFNIPSNIPLLRFEHAPIAISENSPAYRSSEQLLENPPTTREWIVFYNECVRVINDQTEEIEGSIENIKVLKTSIKEEKSLNNKLKSVLEDKETEIRDKDNEIMALKHYVSRMEADILTRKV